MIFTEFLEFVFYLLTEVVLRIINVALCSSCIVRTVTSLQRPLNSLTAEMIFFREQPVSNLLFSLPFP
jgi:hypothetical protein